MADAMLSYEEARDLYQRLIREHPDVADYRFRLSGVLWSIGLVHEYSGRTDLALLAAGKARDLPGGRRPRSSRRLGLPVPSRLGVDWIGQIHHRRTDRPAEAIPYYRRAIELLERLVRENPQVRTYPMVLAFGYCYLGQVLRQAGRESEAKDLSRKALTLFDRIDTEGLADYYELACVRSLSSVLVRSDGSDADAVRSRHLADRAVEALRQAIAGGYQDLALIEHDTDLDPLRWLPTITKP